MSMQSRAGLCYHPFNPETQSPLKVNKMNRKGQSFYIETSGPEDSGIIEGFTWLINQAKKTDAREGLVSVNNARNLTNIAAWSKLKTVVEQLAQRGEVFVKGVTVRLLTQRSSLYSWNGPILAIYGGQSNLDKVDALSGESDVVYVPWSEQDYVPWAQTWNAVPLGSASQPANEVAAETDMTSVAIKHLADSINLGTGLVDPSDRQRAIEVVETLFHKGIGADPEKIRQHAVRSGLNPADAAELKKLAEMIWNGRRPRGSKGKADEGLLVLINSFGFCGKAPFMNHGEGTEKCQTCFPVCGISRGVLYGAKEVIWRCGITEKTLTGWIKGGLKASRPGTKERFFIGDDIIDFHIARQH